MLIVMASLAFLATAMAYQQGLAAEGLRQTTVLLKQVAPVLLPAFLLAGMVGALVPAETLSRLLGSEAGMRGILIGAAAGALTPGGPFLAFPLLALLLEGGASVGAVSAYLTSWALLGVHRMLAFEIPILGWRFVAVRVAASLLMPICVGWLAQQLWTKVE